VSKLPNDLRCLHLTGGFVNDAILNFLLKWISRQETESESVFLFFNSWRVGQIFDERIEVESKKQKNGLDLFKKQILVLPYSKDLHWSDIFVMFQGRLKRNDGTFPFILFFDPIRTVHCENKIHDTICNYLYMEMMDPKPRTRGN
jgi:Ulp1 family protease